MGTVVLLLERSIEACSFIIVLTSPTFSRQLKPADSNEDMWCFWNRRAWGADVIGLCARRASAVYIHSVSRPGVSCSGRRGREGRYSHIDALELRACMGSAVAGAEVTELN